MPSCMTLLNNLFKTKPIEVIKAEESSGPLERHLKLFDLLMIGIGGTVGTGIFTTAADIIRETAGPAAAISWILGGIGCVLSGFAYMELTTRVPSAGSCYAYSFHALGELPAVIGGWLLTLEYGFSGAGVARSWAQKVQEVCEDLSGKDFQWLNEKHYNLVGFSIQALCVLILLFGLNVGKTFVNVMTLAKISVVLFMIFAGFSALQMTYWDPFIIPRTDEKYGVAGVMIGASQAFFGYIGFDEVCCLAAETSNPKKTMPRAVLGVILGTAVLSVFASLALSGMAPYTEITSFGSAFGYAGYEWAKHIVQFGELITMPVVVLISFLAQPRLQYAMAIDGLLPKIFAKVEKNGNIFYGTLISGILFSLIAFTVPFSSLWDMVNFGVLTSFNLTNSALVILRTREQSPLLGPSLQVSYLIISATAAFLWQKGVVEVNLNGEDSSIAMVLAIITSFLAFVNVILLWWKCPQSYAVDDSTFAAPFVPFTPAIAVAFNWFLIAQLTPQSLSYGCYWILLAIFSYVSYGYWNSVARKTNWQDILGDRKQSINSRLSSIFYRASKSPLN